MSELTSVEKLLTITTPGTLINHVIINGNQVATTNFISFNQEEHLATFTPGTDPEYLVVDSRTINGLQYCRPEQDRDHN
ncbi:hypothetical protein LC087_15090 [Bacillus carboniphilus]|uniref:Uncharacterized protein n=1 Tax=Bacillus carboniphilus TaxID=86663 RepID=A0ABY9JRP7_9BACI|nr:hypothetical protein [Bacillus carboniphilus]WLR42079.1 hypothetical protein LC087_15090 [Bacillus carboniphilus]